MALSLVEGVHPAISAARCYRPSRPKKLNRLQRLEEGYWLWNSRDVGAAVATGRCVGLMNCHSAGPAPDVEELRRKRLEALQAPLSV